MNPPLLHFITCGILLVNELLGVPQVCLLVCKRYFCHDFFGRFAGIPEQIVYNTDVRCIVSKSNWYTETISSSFMTYNLSPDNVHGP